MAKIIISEEDRNLVQKADVEMSSRMNLISFMMTHNMDTESEQFKKYESDYKDAYLAFEKAKTYISNKYLANVGTASWSLDYESRELTYEC